jgi:hypothetical protein
MMQQYNYTLPEFTVPAKPTILPLLRLYEPTEISKKYLFFLFPIWSLSQSRSGYRPNRF